jgi:RimJ/RimL family protein N-acetyltransferase
VEISQLFPDDGRAVREVTELLAAAGAADCPGSLPHTVASYTGLLRHGWDGEPPTTYVGRTTPDGPIVGLVAVDLPARDNTHLGWLGIDVHPDHRRRGHGTELLAFGTDVARQAGRRVLGIDGWDTAGSRAFAERHGFERKSAEVNRRQLLAELDWTVLDKLYDEALRAAGDYRLLRITDAVPDGLLDDVVRMTAAINDAPTDDLDIEDEVFSPERIRAFEQAMAGWDRTLYRVVAQHKESGELGGHSLVGVERDRPDVGWQLDTAVVRAHRGHRLGLLVKIDLLRWLREAEPKMATIDTWNAESNQHMIAVNEQLAYRIIGRALDYQKPL